MSTLVAICDTDGDGKISEEVNPFSRLRIDMLTMVAGVFESLGILRGALF